MAFAFKKITIISYDDLYYLTLNISFRSGIFRYIKGFKIIMPSHSQRNHQLLLSSYFQQVSFLKIKNYCTNEKTFPSRFLKYVAFTSWVISLTNINSEKRIFFIRKTCTKDHFKSRILTHPTYLKNCLQINLVWKVNIIPKVEI